jgi:hypothetical protein
MMVMVMIVVVVVLVMRMVMMVMMMAIDQLFQNNLLLRCDSFCIMESINKTPITCTQFLFVYYDFTGEKYRSMER